jgi:hypothetical protein
VWNSLAISRVVVLRARPAAQRAEVEPDHATRAPHRLDLARLDAHHRVQVARFRELVERGLHRGLGLGPQWCVVERNVRERALAVVGAVVHVHHLQPLLQQPDRGQDAVAVQAVGVELVGVEVRGGDEAHAVAEQRVQQAVQDHRVRHVRHVELIEADQLVALGDALTQHIQRVLRALQVAQFAVHLAHELVKVQARLALERHGLEEAFHEEALAAPDPTEHVHAAWDVGPVDELLQRIGALALVVRPLVRAALQRVHGPQLGRVGRVAALLERGLVGAADAQGGVRSSACACRRPARLPSSPRTARGARGRCARCPRRWP